MLKTVLFIVLSVTLFGILFFLYVKRALKRQLNFYLKQNEKKINKKSNHFN